MIKRALELKEAINFWTLQVDQGAYSELLIKKSEWDELEKLKQLLEVRLCFPKCFTEY